MVMKSIVCWAAGLATFVHFSAALASDDLFSRPWISKFMIERTVDIEKCEADLTPVLDSIAEKEDSTTFGVMPPIVFTEADLCYSSVILASKQLPANERIQKEIERAGFQVTALVENVKGTFMGMAAIAVGQDGSAGYCANKNELLSPVNTWMDGFMERDTMLTNLSERPLKDRTEWIEANFECGPLSALSTVEILLEIANTADCPFNGDTLRTCFLLRGVKKFYLPTVN